MNDYLPVLLGGGLLWVLLELAERSRPVAWILCRASLHRWRMAAHTTRHRTCTGCRRVEMSAAHRPRPWDWRRIDS